MAVYTVNKQPGRASQKAQVGHKKADKAFVIELSQILKDAYQQRGTDLRYNSPIELLIAAILSTQSTDQEVNALMPSLLTQYPTVKDLASAQRGQLEYALRSMGFYRQKAKYLQETARILIDKYDGQVPDNLTELTQLPGVARKIASLYLAEIHNTAEGIFVDTNVHRVANRLGLSDGKSATKVEQDLMKIVPQELWISFAQEMLAHGRRQCHIRRPSCRNCPLKDLCPSAENGKPL